MNKSTKDDVGPRLTYADKEKMYAESRATAMRKALDGEKVRFQSTSSKRKFMNFLKTREELWNELITGDTENTRLRKGYTMRYHERMRDKTSEIIKSMEAC